MPLLDYKSPFHILHHRIIDYHSFRVFIGYNSIHKGYLCLHSSTGRIYITCHVIFDELVFPFSRPLSTSSSSPQLASILTLAIPAPLLSTFPHVSSPTLTDDPSISTLITHTPPPTSPNSSIETLLPIIQVPFSDTIVPSSFVIKPTIIQCLHDLKLESSRRKFFLLFHRLNHRHTHKPLKTRIGVLLCKLSMQP